MDYKNAGVDIEAGYKSVELMKKHVARTMIPGVIDGIGGFGGLFAPNLSGMKEPVLVSGTDGVGTKLRLAQLLDKHDTIGIDCVAMCVNDIICCGAKPLFFLDYIAIGKNIPEKVADIVSGVAEGCVQSGCALIGGETAEHPGVMVPDDYDIAGFAVGVVDKPKIIDAGKVAEGDALIGLTSSGVHSNGFSLVRKVFDIENADLTSPMDELNGKSLGEVLFGPPPSFMSRPCRPFWTAGSASTAPATSPAAASLRIFPGCFLRVWAQKSSPTPFPSSPSSISSKSEEISLSTICTTPSTWAWAWSLRCPQPRWSGRWSCWRRRAKKMLLVWALSPRIPAA